MFLEGGKARSAYYLYFHAASPKVSERRKCSEADGAGPAVMGCC